MIRLRVQAVSNTRVLHSVNAGSLVGRNAAISVLPLMALAMCSIVDEGIVTFFFQVKYTRALGESDRHGTGRPKF